jgi:hypothetical protein
VAGLAEKGKIWRYEKGKELRKLYVFINSSSPSPGNPTIISEPIEMLSTLECIRCTFEENSDKV